jgi:hypothetical protein
MYQGASTIIRKAFDWTDNIEVIIEEDLVEKVHVDRIHVTPDMDQWRALVSMVMNSLQEKFGIC